MRYYEDITVGETAALGSHEVAKADLIEFAERYDPQPFHVDEEAAADSVFGGLIASGWYSASVCMRLLVDGYLSATESMGAFGLDELRWPTPVRPGDVIEAEVEILDKRPSGSRDDRGYVQNRVVGRNGDGDTVVEWRATNIVGRRPDEGDEP
jgi:acyl dehydratase